MTGWLVTNHFVRSEKFDEIFVWLGRSASGRGINLIRKTNAQVMCAPGRELAEKPDFVLFWDKDIHLARYLERAGLRLFNTADAIAWCDDKALTHIRLHGSGIAMPATVAAPKTFPRPGYNDQAFLREIAGQIGFPMVVKECFGSFGQQVYLARGHDELTAVVDRVGIEPMLFQEFVESSAGRDVRVQVVGGKCIAAMRRWSTTGDFRSNVTNGGRAESCDLTGAQAETALRAAAELGLDFAGIDLLYGKDGKPLLCEVNSNAHFINLYNCTGVNAADAIIDHIAGTIG
jgi:RimK family alpha-L-glutamate ligase